MSNSKRLEAIKTRLNKIPKLTTPISHATFQVQDVRDLLAVVSQLEEKSRYEGECLLCMSELTSFGDGIHDSQCAMLVFTDIDTQEILS